MGWIIAFGILFLICIAEWMREIHTFVVTHYEIASPKLQSWKAEKKFLVLSDLHNTSYGKENAKLLEAIYKEQPDLILIAGDMLVGKPNRDATVAQKLVEQLTEICPVYYANGNHEYRMKIYPEVYGSTFAKYKAALEEKGVIFLENTSEKIVLDGVELTLSGLEIDKKYYSKGKRHFYPLEEMEQQIGGSDEKSYQILFAHNPLYMNTYLKWKADLILSGHLHGGVVRIPGVGGVITPQFGLFPYYSGEHRKKGKTDVVVSRGLGTHTIKIRFLNTAELIVLHMNGGTDGDSSKVTSV